MSGPGTARTQDGDVNNSPVASEAPVVDGATASADHPSASRAHAIHRRFFQRRAAPAPTAASTGPTIKVERSPSDEASVEDEEMEGGEDDSAADRNSKKGRSGAKGDDRDDALLSPKKQRAQKRKYRHKVGEKTRRDQTNRLYHQLEKNLYRANPSLQQTRRSRVVLLEMASEAIDRLLAETERLRHDLEVATNQPQKRQKFVSDVAISSPSSTTYSLSSACPPVTQFDHPALVPSTSVSSFASFVASSSLPFPSPPLSDQSDAALHTLRQAMSSNSLSQYDPSFSASQSAVQLHHASLINPTHPQPQPTTILDPMSNSAYVSSAYPPGPNPAAPSFPGSSPTPSQKRGFEQILPSSLNKPTVPPQAYDIFNARVEQSGQFNYSARSFVPADSTGRSGPRQSQAQNASPEERGAVASLMSKDLSHADARELERLLQQQWAPPSGGPPQPQQTAVSAQTQAMGGVQSTPPRGPNPYSLVTSANFSAQLTAGAARNVMPPSPAPSSMFSTGHSSGAGPSPGPIPKFDGSYQQVMFRCHLNQSGSIISGNDGGIQFLASLLLQTVDPSISSADASSVLRTNLHHNILAIVSPEEMRRVFEALSAIGNGSCYSICLPNIQLACPRATWAALLPRPRIGGVVVPENITARMNMVVCARITQEGVFEGYECAFTFTE